MESRLLQVSGVTAGLPGQSSRASQQQGSFRVAAQRFMRGVDLESGRFQGRRVSRSRSVLVVAARRPAVQEEAVVSKDEYVESVSEPQGHESSYVGSPLLWIGVGVGLSALFSFGANQVKRYAMQQMLKSMTGGAGGASPSGVLVRILLELLVRILLELLVLVIHSLECQCLHQARSSRSPCLLLPRPLLLP